MGSALAYCPSPLADQVLARGGEEVETEGIHRVPRETHEGRRGVGRAIRWRWEAELLLQVPVVVACGPQLDCEGRGGGGEG